MNQPDSIQIDIGLALVSGLICAYFRESVLAKTQSKFDPLFNVLMFSPPQPASVAALPSFETAGLYGAAFHCICASDSEFWHPH